MIPRDDWTPAARAALARLKVADRYDPESLVDDCLGLSETERAGVMAAAADWAARVWQGEPGPDRVAALACARVAIVVWALLRRPVLG